MLGRLIAHLLPLNRIADALERLVHLYEMDLEARGIRQVDPTLEDRVEVQYGPHPEED